MLPLTSKETAKRVSEILADTCAGIAVTDEYQQSDIEFRAGIANMPEDCTTLEEMLIIANQAKGLSG